MESGSIFVCFLCEKEFREVDLLQEHMKDHGSVPEMSNELPSRKRSANKDKSNSQYKVVKKQKTNLKTNTDNRNHEEIITKERSIDARKEDHLDNSFAEPIKEKSFLKSLVSPKKPHPFATSKRGFVLSRAQYPSSNSEIHKKQESIKEKINLKKECFPCESLSPQDVQMQKAMRLKQLILNREKNSINQPKKEEKKPVNIFEIDENELDAEQINKNSIDEPQESIVMVDSSFFSSGTSNKTPLGPTIMNAEPDGFVCPVPQKSYVAGAPYQRKKKSFARRASSGMREASIASYTPIKVEPSEKDYSAVGQGSPRLHGQTPVKGGRRSKRESQTYYDDDEGMGEDEDWKKRVVRRKGKERSRNDSGSEDSLYQCLACNKQFKSLSTMKTHARSHNEDKEIHCPYCDEVFPQRYILYEHLVNDHEESSNLTCPICNKIFTRPDSLKSHMVRMHEENGGLNCYVCGKNFPSQGQLEMHVRVHTGERPFKCDLCGKGFVQKIHLKTHLRTMHNVTDMPTTPCRLCDQKFDGRVSLREHYTDVHHLTSAEYKVQVARLRKEGKIPEVIPPKVKVVDPSFRYKNVPVADVDDDTPKPEEETPKKATRRGRSAAKASRDNRVPGMGTVMNLAADGDIFTPFEFDDMQEPQPKGRDQQELNIVESAFKVAEEMDQMGESSSTILVSGDNNGDGVFFSVPVVLSSERKTNGAALGALGIEDEEEDDEYAQFAAEHAHIDDTSEFAQEEEPEEEPAQQQQHSSRIIKAEPLEIYAQDQTQAVEMFTM